MNSTDHQGVPIEWNLRGSGSTDPILLIMGHAFGANMWHRTTPALEAAHQVLTYENWGVGWSGTPPPPHHTIERMAADAVAVMNAAGIERAHVFGVSMGGLVAQELAIQSPERIGSLILGCTGCPGDADRGRRATPNVMYRAPRRLLVAASKRSMYGKSPLRSTRREDARLLRATRTNYSGLVAQARAVADYQSFDRVPQISAPTLVLHGDADRIVPPGRGRELASRIPGAELKIFPGAGHNFPSELPDQVNGAVLAFVAAHPMVQIDNHAE